MRRSLRYGIVAAAIASAAILAASLLLSRGRVLRPEEVLAAYHRNPECGQLTVRYPLDGTLFPPEAVPPTFRWEATQHEPQAWLVSLEFEDNDGRLDSFTRASEWTPSDEQWEQIKRRSLEKEARVTIIGLTSGSSFRILSAATLAIRTSKDPVGAPLFYREVNLPFVDAVKDPSLIQWRFGSISSKMPPPIILKGLPVCANCHSFSADGTILGMDVDYANDKASYAITPVTADMVLAKSKIITWADYQRDANEPTFGLLSQVSPDGRYVVSTVKDRSVFVPRPGLEFSQLFFPFRGILVIYRRDTRTFSALSGADDKAFVQSNPSWSPDGRYILFARSKALELDLPTGKLLLSEEECKDFLTGGKTFLFDLYRVPFNDGKGGRAEPLEGASHNGMSNFFGRYSPDGKWIVFCKARTFMLLQPDSELFIVPAKGGTARRMRCNTPRMNSWHSWSPNGKWLVFSSKANGPYTQLFLTHVDERGDDTPPVLLANLSSSDRAVNIPEFVNTTPGAITRISEQFVDDLSFARAGEEYLRGRDHGRAEKAFRRALELNPDNARAHDGLGVALGEQGKLNEAIAHHAEAVRLDPNDPHAHYHMAVDLEYKGQLDDAVAQYAQTLRLDPKYASAHSHLGTVLATQGRIEEANTHFLEALRLNPSDARAHYGLGVSLASQGKLDEAIAHYTEAVKADPGYALAHNNLGACLAAQGKLDEAISHFAAALKIDPQSERTRANLERALQQRTRRKMP